MKTLILLLISFLAFTASYSQSIFKRIPKPAYEINPRISASVSTEKTMTAFRFTAPIAGFEYPQNQVVTGLGYGFQRLHFIDSTKKWYVDYSINAIACVGGNVVKPLTPQNITTIGIGLGVLNELVMIIPCYNLPVSSNIKGSIGIIFSVAVPLNN